MDQPGQKQEPLIFNEAQFLLAEKRTQLATLRTGLAVLAVPLSLETFLIVTSRFYHVGENFWYLLPVHVICLLLLGLGAYLIVRGLRRLRQCGAALSKLRRKNPILTELEQDAGQ
jgi:uncharacterized membrane protein YidH (DUF202 family)